MAAYEPAYAEDAVEALLTASAAQRHRARTLVLQLCRTPARKGDYRVTDRNGHTWEVLLIDDVLLTYRADELSANCGSPPSSGLTEIQSCCWSTTAGPSCCRWKRWRPGRTNTAGNTSSAAR